MCNKIHGSQNNPPPAIDEPAKVSKSEIKGKYAPGANLSPEGKQLGTLLEQRPVSENGKGALSGAKILARNAIAGPASLAVAGMPEMLSKENLATICVQVAKNRKSSDKLEKSLGEIRSALEKGEAFDGMSKSEKKTYLSALQKSLRNAMDATGTGDSEETREMARTLKEQSLAVKTLLDGLANSSAKDNLSFDELRTRGLEREPAFKEVGKALDEYWKAHDKYTNANYATMTMEEKTDLLAAMNKSLMTLLGKIDKAAQKGHSSPAALETLSALKEATTVQIQSLAATAQDETKANLALKGKLTGLAERMRLLQGTTTGDDLVFAENEFAGLITEIETIVAKMGKIDNKRLVEAVTALNMKIGKHFTSRVDAIENGNKNFIIKEILIECEVTMARGLLQPGEDILFDIDAAGKMAKVDIQSVLSVRSTGLSADAYIAALRVKFPLEEITNFGLDESMMAKHSLLGAGVANSVHKATFRQGVDGDPEIKVLKTDSSASRGLSDLAVGKYQKMNDGHSATGRNFAMCEVAKKLGMGHILPKVKAVVHRSELVLAMQAAPGREIGDVADDYNKVLEKRKNPGPNDGPVPDHPLDDPKTKKLVAQELCKLEWLDAICGQLDRHCGNCLIDFSDGNVQVSAIDNDLSFGADHHSPGIINYMESDKTYDLSHVQTDSYLLRQVENIVGNEDKSYRIRKEVLDGERNNCGAHGVGLPSLIDRTTYDALMGVDENNLVSLLGDAAKFLSPEAYQCAVERLKVARNHAQMLHDKGLVIDDWETWTLPQDLDSPTVALDGVTLTVPAGVGPVDYLLQCGGLSYYGTFFVDAYRPIETHHNGIVGTLKTL